VVVVDKTKYNVLLFDMHNTNVVYDVDTSLLNSFTTDTTISTTFPITETRWSALYEEPREIRQMNTNAVSIVIIVVLFKRQFILEDLFNELEQ
ncbi:16325_t:CDS:1, partial [Racocetra persica]